MSEVIGGVRQYPDAACAKPWIDPDIFFGLAQSKEEKQALPICNGMPAKSGQPAAPPCPARERCLADELEVEKDTPDQHVFGIYGGKTAMERVRARHTPIPVDPLVGAPKVKPNRGSAAERRRRKTWLLENTWPQDGPDRTRCCRCDTSLTFETLRCIRIDVRVGFHQDNIRPACQTCVAKAGGINGWSAA